MKTNILTLMLFLSSWPVFADSQLSMINRKTIQDVAGEYVGTSVPYGDFVPNCNVLISQTNDRIEVKITSDDGFDEHQQGKPVAKLETVTYPVRSIQDLLVKMSGAEIGPDAYFALRENKRSLKQFSSTYMLWNLTNGDLTSVQIQLDVSGILDFYSPSQYEVSADCRELRRM